MNLEVGGFAAGIISMATHGGSRASQDVLCREEQNLQGSNENSGLGESGVEAGEGRVVGHGLSSALQRVRWRIRGGCGCSKVCSTVRGLMMVTDSVVFHSCTIARQWLLGRVSAGTTHQPCAGEPNTDARAAETSSLAVAGPRGVAAACKKSTAADDCWTYLRTSLRLLQLNSSPAILLLLRKCTLSLPIAPRHLYRPLPFSYCPQ